MDVCMGWWFFDIELHVNRSMFGNIEGNGRAVSNVIYEPVIFIREFRTSTMLKLIHMNSHNRNAFALIGFQPLITIY